MKLEIVNQDEIIIIKPLANAINAAESSDFKSQIVDIINKGNHLILLDLSQVDFVDSSGLGTIISLLKIVKTAQGQIAMCEIKPTVLNLFKLTRMDQFFDIRANQKASIDHLKTTATSK